jgi:hypothetical protein
MFVGSQGLEATALAVGQGAVALLVGGAEDDADYSPPAVAAAEGEPVTAGHQSGRAAEVVVAAHLAPARRLASARCLARPLRWNR